LTVGQGAATSGNGWTVLPYYWSPEGYAALGVSADDDKPASWRLESAARQLSQDLTARGLTWSFVGPVADLYLMPAQDLRQAARSLADLTGHAPVPPKWSFGYLQSRWGWGCGEKPCPSPLTHAEDLGTADIDSTIQHFRTQHFPVDAFIFDFESFAPIEDFPGADYALSCTGDARYHDFTLSSLLFPEPHKEISAYRAQGIQIIPIRKPRIGNLSDLTFLRGQNPAWVNACTNENKNSVDARLMQFDKTGARDWYAQALQPMLNAGVSGWWNDEGEATFSTYYDWNQAELKAEIENAKLRGQAQNRHWSLNRAFSPGLARLGASVWTGDNHSTWTALRQTSTNLLNLSLGGMPYGATDLGGFMGPQNETPAIQANYAQLLTRWLELGVFLPIMRTHSRDTTLPHFPWLAAPYGGSPDPQAVNAIRKALNLRYRLVPYYYSLAHETSITGIPLMRPLAMEYPSDDIVATMTDQWLMGSHLMAAPIQTPSEKRNIYFPETMLSFDGQSLRTANADASRFAQQMLFNAKSSYQVTATLGEIPVFVKTGTILTLAPAVSDSTGWPAQNTSELTDGPLEVQVYEGANTTFTLFEDDGTSYDYQNSQLAGFRKTIFKWDETNKILSWQREGTYGTNVFTKIRVVRFDLNGHKTVDPVRELSASGSTAR
jgi:alpha-glucosidase